MGDIVDIQLGRDLFEARVITEAVLAEGFNVELREMYTEGIHLSFDTRHILMVRADDFDEVVRIVGRSFTI